MRTRRFLIFFSQSVIAWLFISGFAFALDISLREHVSLNGNVLRFLDVVTNPESFLTSKVGLRDLVLINGLKPRQRVYIARQSLVDVLRRAGFVGAEKIVWQGAEQVVVDGEVGQEIAESYLVGAAEKHLIQHLKIQGYPEADVRYFPPTTATQLIVASGEVIVTPRPLPMAEVIRSKMTIYVDIFVNGQFAISRELLFGVANFAPVALANNDLPDGQVIACGDVEWKMLDIFSLAEKRLDPCRQRVIARESIRSGSWITERRAKVLSEVEKGSPVILRFSTNGVTVEKMSTALASANKGQLVLVQPVGGNATLKARVIDKGITELVQ